MLRTTKKEVKQAVRAYILDCLDFSNYIGWEGYPKEEPATDGGKIRLCYDIFKSEYMHEIKRYGENKAFMEWLRCLPTALTIDFYYIDCRRILADWLQETEEESYKFDDVQVWDRFRQLITREFFAMLRRAEK